MSLYNEKRFSGSLGKLKKPLLIAIIAIILVVFIAILINSVNWSNMFKGDNISVKFENNPLVISKKDNTVISITIKNNSDVDVSNARVAIVPVDDTFIVFCPDAIDSENTIIEIPIIAKDNKRTVYCNIRYDESRDLLEGTYSFDIDYSLNNELFKERVKLNVKR